MVRKLGKIFLVFLLIGVVLFAGCESTPRQPVSDSGVTKASANVQTQANGLTIEQENIKKRYEMENLPGSVKHLYIISPYSGQVILYSTVKGKVTSGGKRLTPSNLVGVADFASAYMNVYINGQRYKTPEVIGDDGTYGSSGNYIYWWDTKDIYHQHYLGNEILHISDSPVTFNSVITEQEVAIKDDFN